MSVKRLFSFHGLYEVLSIGGVWNVFILIGLFVKKYRKSLYTNLSTMWVILFGMVVVQALLSHELARMFYLLTPLLALMVALFFDVIQKEREELIN
jgi:hypothetical protein